MTARVVIVAMLALALVAGAALYWLQLYAFYRELSPAQYPTFDLTREDGTVAALPVSNFEGIDSSSSPIRFRACFELDATDAAGLRPYPGAEPLTAPGWFGCYDARAIAQALEAGEAMAVLGEAGVVEGVDRVVAVFPDGRAYAWHQIDPCGTLSEERPGFCEGP